MMKRTLIGATFVAAFAGAVGVSATTVQMKGSDTLFDLTTAVIAACPGTTPPYAGTGSGNGQNAMVAAAATQFVAPMSRFINNGACTAPAGGTPAGAQSDGLVIALDGVSFVGSKTTFTNATCNGDHNPTCSATFEPTTGVAYNTPITTSTGTYTFGGGDIGTVGASGWRDVLRVLLAGFSHSGPATGSGAAAWAARDCNSPERIALANTYGNFFENHCAAAAGETTTTTCTQVRHVFRRDDFSGTTDTVTSLLGLPTTVLPTSAAPTGASPFCNTVRPAFVFPAPLPTCLQGSDATWDPTILPTAANLGACPRENGVYRSTNQDNDPIRRNCAAQEQVCAHSKDLGLVLPMNDVPEPGTRTNADRYNATACSNGSFTSATPPDIYDAITQRQQICANLVTGAKIKLCPNGDVCSPTGACNVPAINGAPTSSPNNPQCRASVLQAPGATASLTPVPLIHPVGPGVAEGRAFNQHLYILQGTAGAYQTNAAGQFVTGAYYRIHTTTAFPATAASFTTPGVICQFPDMTDQIGCLVHASPCSIGYAGLGALAQNLNSDALKINKQTPEDVCITGDGASIGGFTYPLSRKLYLSSIVGFANVSATGTANEDLHLAACETDSDQAGITPPTTAAGVNFRTLVASPGINFIAIPSFVNGGKPYCEDFNENMLCGAATNNNGCNTAPSNGLVMPTLSTTCGNGIREQYEDCDCGTAGPPDPPGVAPSAPADNVTLCGATRNGGTVCTTTCRTVQ